MILALIALLLGTDVPQVHTTCRMENGQVVPCGGHTLKELRDPAVQAHAVMHEAEYTPDTRRLEVSCLSSPTRRCFFRVADGTHQQVAMVNRGNRHVFTGVSPHARLCVDRRVVGGRCRGGRVFSRPLTAAPPRPA